MIDSKIKRAHWRWLLAVAAVGVVVAWAYRPAMAGFREWRAKQLLVKAGEHFGSGNWTEARRAALASGQLDPSIESVRLYFEIQHQSRDPGVLRAATALALHPGATGNDRAAALATFLDARDLIGFGLILRTFKAADQNLPKVRFEIVRFLLATGKPTAAVHLADTVPESDRTPDFDLLLARELIGSPSAEARDLACDRLGTLLGDPQRPFALAALGILATQPDGFIRKPLAQQAVDRFATDPALTVRERLAVALLQLGIAIDPEDRTAVVERTIAEHQEQNFERLLHWLLRIKAYSRVVDLTDAVEIKAPIMAHRGAALIGLGELKQWQSELENPPEGLKPVDLSVSRATVARLLGQKPEEENQWRQAFAFAKLRPSENQYYDIALAAGQAGATDQQMEALACAIEHPLGIPPPSDQLAALTAWLATRDTRRLLAISRRLLEREPGNPSLINNFHYLTTLHGHPGDQTVSTLEKLVEAFPDSISFRGSLAFAHLKTGHPAAARACLDATNLPPESLPNTEKALYSAVLATLGEKSQADALRRSVDWAKLDDGETEAFKVNP